jgi:hypothetical protein
MKKIINYALLISLIILLVQCKGNKNANGAGGDNSDSTKSEFAVCIWDRTPVKDSPDENGKWIASLNLGEKCTFLDDTKDVNNGTKTLTYYKVKLLDGKEGWAQKDLIILNSRPATLVENAEIYSRPDLLTKTNNSFSRMDIVAVKSTQNGFLEITGKRKDGKWIESGWIKEANLTFEDVDIAVAKFALNALKNTDETKRNEEINKIITNPDFSKSVFIEELTSIINTYNEKTVEDAIKTEIDTSDLKSN